MMGNKEIMAELFRLGELPKEWNDKIDRETIDGEVREILESDKDILSRYKPSLMARQIEEKGQAERSKGRRKNLNYALAGLSAAAAMLVLGLILPGVIPGSGTSDISEITRPKGFSETVLTVYRNTGADTEVLDESTVARERDLVQLGYSVPVDMPYGIILSVDGRGVVTRHLAPEGESALALSPGGEHLLDFSYELDDAPRFETFYLLVSDKPFPVDPVIDIISREARSEGDVLNIPDILRRSSLDLNGTGKMLQYAVSIPKEEIE
ncbi:MAG: hypothetical protein PQJ60_13135 [Spirochaetales bacterium]|nr:hypothetical protein [Spirochaetales bacterium]